MKNVHRLSRRSLLGTSAAIGSAGLVLAACGQVQTTAAPMEQAAEAPKEEAKSADGRGTRAGGGSADQSAREHDCKDGGHAGSYSTRTIRKVDVAWKLGYPPGELPPLLAAGSPPDVSWWGVAPHQVADLVRDHRPILKAHGIDISEFVEPVVTGNTWQGKLLGVPYGLNTTSLFYNKQHFDTAGLNYPTGRHNLGAGPRRCGKADGFPQPGAGEEYCLGYQHQFLYSAILAVRLCGHARRRR